MFDEGCGLGVTVVVAGGGGGGAAGGAVVVELEDVVDELELGEEAFVGALGLEAFELDVGVEDDGVGVEVEVLVGGVPEVVEGGGGLVVDAGVDVGSVEDAAGVDALVALVESVGAPCGGSLWEKAWGSPGSHRAATRVAAIKAMARGHCPFTDAPA